MKVPHTSLLAALHGRFDVHPWIDLENLEEDVYSLFVSRSAAMGWLAPAAGALTGGLYGMNDAGQTWLSTADSHQVAWCQVALATTPTSPLLPLQPVLRCLGDVVQRVGSLRLETVQMYLPVHHALDTRTSLVARGLNWFNTGSGDSRRSFRMSVDGGEDPAVLKKSSDILEAIQRVNTGLFEFTSVEAGPPVAVAPPVVGEMWLGKGHHQADFRGSVPEWSLDSIGLASSLVAQSCRLHEIKSGVLVTVSQD